MLKSEFFRFLITGFTNTVIGYVAYWILNIWLPYELAYTIAYALGILFSYWLNVRWVFRAETSLKTFLAFPSVYVVQYLCNILMLHVLVERMAIPEWCAPILVTVATIPITFFMSRYIIRHSRTATTENPR